MKQRQRFRMERKREQIARFKIGRLKVAFTAMVFGAESAARSFEALADGFGKFSEAFKIQGAK